MGKRYVIRDGQLYHWGLKGMKWGVRRYQNKDGTLTDAGKKRYYRDADNAGYKEQSGTGARYKITKKGKKERYDADVDKWVKDDIDNASGVLNKSASITGNLKNLNEIAKRNRKQTRVDLSNMTDKEMRDKINREMLERQYNDMFTPQKAQRGHEYVSTVLEVAGSVLTIGATSLMIAQGIKNLKG